MKQRTEEWYNYRLDKIGASDAPIIMGVSPWKTPMQLWEEKMGFKKESPITACMQYGIDNEELAIKLFEEMTGHLVFPQVLNHKNYEWMIASLDGMDIWGKVAVEIKCTNTKDHKTAKEGKVPKKYYPQLQHQMEVTGLNKIYYFSFNKGTGYIVEIEKDETYISKLIEKEKAFYDCMMSFTPPLS